MRENQRQAGVLVCLITVFMITSMFCVNAFAAIGIQGVGNPQGLNTEISALKDSRVFGLSLAHAGQSNGETSNNGCGNRGEPLMSNCFEYAGHRYNYEYVLRGAFMFAVLALAIYAIAS